MLDKLDKLRNASAICEVERAGAGFVVIRRRQADGDAFNALVREAIEGAGQDYVALPVTDGSAGYDRVVIIPF